jgi:L-alanine-DL-glutamate epimerase-like enolase superfamily enzyme
MSMGLLDSIPTIESVTASAFTVPTDEPESDGTLAWASTTLVLVEALGAGERGLGYTYTDESAAELVRKTLAPIVEGQNALAPESVTRRLVERTRSFGGAGLPSQAISAVDVALWDLKAKLLGLPLVELLGSARRSVLAYGSGGFTSYADRRLREQLNGFVEAGMSRVKMKIGRHPNADVRRVEVARDAIGPDVELFVDASGAYSRKQALEFADAFYDFGVTWFEEPVPADDIEGMHLLRDRFPPGMDLAGGEYEADTSRFRRLLEADTVDVLQADATRCLGVTGFRTVAALCDGFAVPLSTVGAPALHAHLGCALGAVAHTECFHDHARIEDLLFDGTPRLSDGRLEPDRTQPGHGLALKRVDAQKFAA